MWVQPFGVGVAHLVAVRRGIPNARRVVILEMALAHSWQRLLDEVRAHESEIGEAVAERLLEDATALRDAEGPGPQEPGEPIMGPPGPAGPAGPSGS